MNGAKKVQKDQPPLSRVPLEEPGRAGERASDIQANDIQATQIVNGAAYFNSPLCCNVGDHISYVSGILNISIADLK